MNCSQCGKKIGFMSDFLMLDDKHQLCSSCMSHIYKDFSQLYSIREQELFYNTKAKIIAIAKQVYSPEIAYYVEQRIQSIEEKYSFYKPGENTQQIGSLESAQSSQNTQYYQPTVTVQQPVEYAEESDDEDFMFSNIGGKLKKFAVVFTYLGIIISVIYGFVLISQDDDLILPGVLTVFLGSLGSWICSLFLYAFGQLVQNTDKLVRFEKEKREKK